MKKILYISRFGVNETAPGMRVLRVGKVLQQSGFRVQFMCVDIVRDIVDLCESKEKYITPQQYFYGLKKHFTIIDTLTGRISLHFIKRQIKRDKPDIIIIYNDIGHITKKLIPICNKLQIKLGADVTEWYDTTVKSSRERYIAKCVDNRIRNIDPKLDFIIAVSPYLEDYYRSKNCRVYWIPPLMEKIGQPFFNASTHLDGKKLRIGYAGNAGQKDLLEPIIEAAERLNTEEIAVQFDLIGVSEAEVKAMLKVKEYEHSGIKAYGRLCHEDALSILEKVDYTILLRKNLRYAKAGFSTKFSESLSLGVPVICNRVGGADKLLENTKAGVLMSTYNSEELEQCIKRLMSLDDEKYLESKKAALSLATQYFSLQRYIKFYGERNGT